MVHDDAAVGLDGVEVVFDDERLVSDTGIALVATLAGRLGIERLVGQFVRLRRDRPGAANAGRKVMALIFAMLLGADSIDDCEVLRAGRTRRLLGGWLPRRPRRWGRSCVRSPSGMCASSTGCSRRRSRARGGRAPARVMVASWSTLTASSARCAATRSREPPSGTPNGGGIPLMASRADTGEVLHVPLRKGKANSSRGVLRFAPRS